MTIEQKIIDSTRNWVAVLSSDLDYRTFDRQRKGLLQITGVQSLEGFSITYTLEELWICESVKIFIAEVE